jgi:GNAT superfamily N-acetyltransferase
MIKLIRTNSNHSDFRRLVALLDQELSEADGDEHPFYAQFNKIDNINHVVVAYLNDVPVGCGAIKRFSDDTAEVKRMYVLPEYRKQGIARKMLKQLESWALELNYDYTVLETGKRLGSAVALYQKENYRIIPNYGQYVGVENSVCMKKSLVGR